MANNSSKNTWITIAIIIVVAVAVYIFFLSGPSTEDLGTLVEAQPEGEIAGAQVLSLLNQIEGLKIDSTLFQSQAYLSLIDYTVPIPVQNVGRSNPFAPIPGFTSKTKN